MVLKALPIFERQDNEHGTASTYHQLGRVAQERRDFDAAETLVPQVPGDLEERQGNEHGAAITYHQAGGGRRGAARLRGRRAWYLKSLAIKERQGNEHGAASTYHQLGMSPRSGATSTAAESWYLKSLAIKERQGNEHGAARHLPPAWAGRRGAARLRRRRELVPQVAGDLGAAGRRARRGQHLPPAGDVAEERRDFDAAEAGTSSPWRSRSGRATKHGAAMHLPPAGDGGPGAARFASAEGWYRKSLAIKERRGDEHRAASPTTSSGVVAEERRDLDAAEGWYLRSLATWVKYGDKHHEQITRSVLERMNSAGRESTEEGSRPVAGREVLNTIPHCCEGRTRDRRRHPGMGRVRAVRVLTAFTRPRLRDGGRRGRRSGRETRKGPCRRFPGRGRRGGDGLRLGGRPGPPGPARPGR